MTDSLFADPMFIEFASGGAVAVFLLGYLFYALIHPEKF
jgi:K+-transporting ATPase KdpF subunit